jgi:hypothetical protein
MDIKEFWEFGYLQEVNRQFLHPLGLALEVIVDNETGEVKLGGVWDYRDDPEGMRFGPGEIEIEKAVRVDKEIFERSKARLETLGYFIQPTND